MSKQKRKLYAVIIIVSIVITVGLGVIGSFYLWSKDCQGKILEGPKSSIVTRCSE